jgi:hypothetical protein
VPLTSSAAQVGGVPADIEPHDTSFLNVDAQPMPSCKELAAFRVLNECAPDL